MTSKNLKGKKDKYGHLTNQYKNIWKTKTGETKEDIFAFSEAYKTFIDEGKTERECVAIAIRDAEAKGYKSLDSKEKLVPGDRVYASVKNKGIVLAVVGKEKITEGFNILGAHIDSPRLDLKPNPLYEEEEMVYFKTHYYGGIKKYQWTAIPLAIHGVVILRDGTQIELNIGEKDEDPVFYITDLLPHLGTEQMSRKAKDAVKGEELNVVIGGMPLEDDDIAKAFKINTLQLLNAQYGITEPDFVSAELEIVPAMRARDVGFDRAFIAGYGHDDRVCAYPAIRALLDQTTPEKTCICLLSDKEETGSNGNTGAQSRLYENILADIYQKINGGYDEIEFRKTIENSKMLSTDVSNAYDPKYASVSDPKNSAYMSYGIKIEKYVGARGKSGTNDANAEFVSSVIRVFNEQNIPWQTGELGKVDEGGGGTISVFMSRLGLEVLDCGVPVMSMHAPYELISKADLYYTYRAYKAFIENI